MLTSLFSAAAKDAAVEVLTVRSCTADVQSWHGMTFEVTAIAVDISGITLGCRKSKESQTRLLCRENLHNWYGRKGNQHERAGLIHRGRALLFFR